MGELIVVGDRVLIEPDDDEQRTDAGLVLPATVKEKEKVGSGRVVRVGPGHLMPNPDYSEGEPWSPSKEAVRYLPLQAEVGDMAFYLRKEAIEITYQGRTYLIVPHAAILVLVRPKPEDILNNIGDLFDEA